MSFRTRKNTELKRGHNGPPGTSGCHGSQKYVETRGHTYGSVMEGACGLGDDVVLHVRGNWDLSIGAFLGFGRQVMLGHSLELKVPFATQKWIEMGVLHCLLPKEKRILGSSWNFSPPTVRLRWKRCSHTCGSKFRAHRV